MSTTTPKSEAEYLKAKAESARAAVKQTLGAVGSGVGKGVSPAEWAKTHPWVTLASATIAGFVGACLAIPSKEQAALRKIERLERALRPETPDNPPQHANGNKPPKKSLLAVLLVEMLKIAGSAAATMLHPQPPPPAQPAAPPEAAP